ncbi:hypothetical protein C1645_842759 [Glomus cerebriforme]|uniref:Uncharacterized protein n=1 Tax=Glomus cerebriforme TaxID=658196 RepID=A0A397S1S3_9GLOM|nr:hypothetical protein C1645_842759 [Glomus cerebriforme]
MNFKNLYVRIEIENEGNLNELLLKFTDIQNNRVFFQPTLSSKFKNLSHNISSLLIKSIEIISSSTNKFPLDISQIQYFKLLNDEVETDGKISDKSLKWNFTFEIIKKENIMILVPLSFDINLNDLCKYLKKFDEEEEWSIYSCKDTVAQCSLGSIFRFYSISRKIFCNGIFNKKFQRKVHVNLDEKKK